MTRTTILPLAGAAMLVLATAASAQDGAAPSGWASGQEAFTKVCARCHTTGVGPEILGRELDPDYITYVVRHGFVAMPPMLPSAIDDATLSQIAALIHESTAPGTPPGLRQDK